MQQAPLRSPLRAGLAPPKAMQQAATPPAQNKPLPGPDRLLDICHSALGLGFWRPSCARGQQVPPSRWRAGVHMGGCTHRGCVYTLTGESRGGVCLLEEEAEQATAADCFHLNQKHAFRLACPGLKLALRGRTQGHREVRVEGDVSRVWTEAPAGGKLTRGTAVGLAGAEVPRGGPGVWPEARSQQLAVWPQGSCSQASGGGSAYLYHGRWVLKAWSHRWQGPAAGQSSSAPSVPGPRAHCACSSKRHSEEDLKGEGSGRVGRPEPQGWSNGPQEAGEDT